MDTSISVHKNSQLRVAYRGWEISIFWLERCAPPCQIKACLWSPQGKTGQQFLQTKALPQRVTLPILVDNSSPSPLLPVGTTAPLPSQSSLQFPALLSVSLLDIPVNRWNQNLCKQRHNHVGKMGPINLWEQLINICQMLLPWRPWKQSKWDIRKGHIPLWPRIWRPCNGIAKLNFVWWWECNVKTYSTVLWTKCYFITILFMWALPHK